MLARAAVPLLACALLPLLLMQLMQLMQLVRAKRVHAFEP